MNHVSLSCPYCFFNLSGNFILLHLILDYKSVSFHIIFTRISVGAMLGFLKLIWGFCLSNQCDELCVCNYVRREHWNCEGRLKEQLCVVGFWNTCPVDKNKLPKWWNRPTKVELIEKAGSILLLTIEWSVDRSGGRERCCNVMGKLEAFYLVKGLQNCSYMLKKMFQL